MQSSESVVELIQEELFESAKTKRAKDPDYVETVSQLTREGVERREKKRPSILGIRCRRSDCSKDLHCFDPTVPKPRFAIGVCQDCGEDAIDWSTVHSRALDDIEVKFNYLNKEWIRHFFFNVPITERIESDAMSHGLGGLAEVLTARLNRSRMQQFDPDWDRRQTPMLDGTIVDWARHATGCCCRQCLRYWHNVPLKGPLTAQDMEYLKQLVMRYVVLRIPILKTEVGSLIDPGSEKIQRKLNAEA